MGTVNSVCKTKLTYRRSGFWQLILREQLAHTESDRLDEETNKHYGGMTSTVSLLSEMRDRSIVGTPSKPGSQKDTQAKGEISGVI